MAITNTPDADWPTWAAAVWCNAFVSGSHSHVMALKFLRAPNGSHATKGAISMLRATYPNGSDFEALVSRVPSSHESNPHE